MAPSSGNSYTVERMRDIGRSSADRAWASLERSLASRLTSLTCEYCGVFSGDGVYLLARYGAGQHLRRVSVDRGWRWA